MYAFPTSPVRIEIGLALRLSAERPHPIWVSMSPTGLGRGFLAHCLGLGIPGLNWMIWMEVVLQGPGPDF